MKLWLPLLLCLVTLTPSWAQSRLETTRASVTALRQTLGEARRKQFALRNELQTLASDIERLKKDKRTAKSRELNDALRRSQDVSQQLTQLAQESSASETQWQRESEELLGLIQAELTQLKKQFETQSDRDTRRATLERMKSLRSERNQVRAAIPSTQVTQQTFRNDEEDPEVLLEQADALRDREEKIRKEMKALEARIAEKREEKELDRRMNAFLGEDALFDDSDRRLRVTARANQEPAVQPAPSRSSAEKANEAPNQTIEAGRKPGQDATVATFESPQANAQATVSSPTPSVSSEGPRVTFTPNQAVDSRPVIGQKPSVAPSLNDDDLDSLIKAKEALRRNAEDLRQQAQSLEKRAQQSQ